MSLSNQPSHWRDYSSDELLAQYSPALAPGVNAEDRARRIQQFEEDFRARHCVVADIAYGNSPRQCLDLIYPHGVVAPPLHIFVHGGYWRRGDRVGHGRCAQTFVENGFAAAIVDFDLCPAVTIAKQVMQVRRAIAFLWRNAEKLHVRQNSFDICGHSTGAHLTAMALSTAWDGEFADVPANVIKSATLISGLYDLEPVATLPQGRDIGLESKQSIEALSPISRTPHSQLRLLIAAGEYESVEFQRQSRALAERWAGSVASCRFEVIPGRDHIDIMDDLQSGSLGKQAVRHAGELIP